MNCSSIDEWETIYIINSETLETNLNSNSKSPRQLAGLLPDGT